MNWIFIVVRNNSVEQTKVFSDFWEGAEYTDSFIKRIDLDFHGNFPAYNRNEYYRRDDLTIGLYKNSNP
jgi:hypothetical protein